MFLSEKHENKKKNTTNNIAVEVKKISYFFIHLNTTFIRNMKTTVANLF